jgi:uncharacterized membrane protein YkoI
MSRSKMLVVLSASVISTAALASATCKPTSPGLATKAKITCEQAQKSALAKVPNGKVVSSELEEENGHLLYSFDVRQPHKSGIEEVQIDAVSGELLGVEHEGPAAEAKEAKEDAPSAHAKGTKKK